MTYLETKMTKEYPNVTLRKLALETGSAYGWILKKARTPIAGQPYDPTATNYEALQEYFDKKEDINLEELDWEAMNEVTTRGGEGKISKDVSKYSVGSRWYLREDNKVPFEVVYTTETHVVIIEEGTQKPFAMSFNTFIAKGPMENPREEEVSA